MSKKNEKTIHKNNYMIIFIPKNIVHLCIMQKFIKNIKNVPFWNKSSKNYFSKKKNINLVFLIRKLFLF